MTQQSDGGAAVSHTQPQQQADRLFYLRQRLGGQMTMGELVAIDAGIDALEKQAKMLEARDE